MRREQLNILTPSCPRAHKVAAAAAAVFIHGSLRTATDLETARPCFRFGRLRFLSDREPAGLDVRGAEGPRHCSLHMSNRNLEQITVDLALVETHISGIQENYNPQKDARRAGGLAAGFFYSTTKISSRMRREQLNILTPSPRAHKVDFPAAAAAAVFIHGSLRTAADLETARPCF